MREQELIVYRNFEDGALLEDMAWIMSRYGSAAEEEEERCPGRPRSRKGMAALFYDCIHRLIELAGNYGFHGNLWHCYLANLLVNNENSYSCGCELRGEIDGTVNEAALHDIVIFKEFYDFDFGPVMEKLQAPEFSLIENYRAGSRESKMYNARICARICQLAEKFCQDHTPEEMKDTLTRFYGEYGVGKFGLHKSFRVEHGDNGVRIEPIPKIAHVALNDLVGYEIAKKKLTDNTDAFVAGRKANNCLLFGDAGTGKSSSIKAIANEYYEKGLRIIEVYKHQFRDLNEVISQIKNRNYRFIIYMDDLSFEEFETEYKRHLQPQASHSGKLRRQGGDPSGYAHRGHGSGEAVAGVPLWSDHLFWRAGQKTVSGDRQNTGRTGRGGNAGGGAAGGGEQVGAFPRRPVRQKRPAVYRLLIGGSVNECENLCGNRCGKL